MNSYKFGLIRQTFRHELPNSVLEVSILIYLDCWGKTMVIHRLSSHAHYCEFGSGDEIQPKGIHVWPQRV